MSLDIWLEEEVVTEVVSMNITHNLAEMAEEAGIYECLWRPAEVGASVGADLIAPLDRAVAEMTADPDRFRKFDAPNGWGTYDDFLPWLEELLQGCKDHPNARVRVCR